LLDIETDNKRPNYPIILKPAEGFSKAHLF